MKQSEFDQVKAILDMSQNLPNLLDAYLTASSSCSQHNMINKELLGQMMNNYISVLNKFCMQLCEPQVINSKI